MSDPLTLATIALTAVNNIGQANAARGQAEQSAALSERQALIARQESARKADDLRRRNAALLARQRVRYGKGGIVVSGTPLDLLADAAAESELAIQDVLHEGDLAAAGHQLRAGLSRRSGRAARRRGLLSAGARLLGDIGPLVRD